MKIASRPARFFPSVTSSSARATRERPTSSDDEAPAARVVVIGGGYAGVLAASRVAGRLGARAEVTLVEAREELVHRVRLHEVVARGPGRRHPLVELLPRRVRHVRARAVAIEAGARRVELLGGTSLPFDHLIVAVGSQLASSIPGALEHGGALEGPERAAAAHAKLAALAARTPAGASRRDAPRVVVVGGGLSGVEVAAEIAEGHPHLAVTLLAKQVLPGVGAGARAYVEGVLTDLGVERLEGVARAVDAGGVKLEGGARLDAALVIWAGGFTSAGAAIASDLACDDDGRLVVDAHLRSVGTTHVWIAGDAAARPPGLPFARMGCALAMPMGAHAADGVVATVRGQAPRPFRFGYAGQCVSLGRRRGLLQMSTPDDRARDTFHSGSVAAFVKELVCSYVIGALRIERRLGGVYTWPRAIEAYAPRGLEAGHSSIAARMGG